ncbi:MAG TPA: STAS domain-containing protein [Terracidiphilus sp.]|jgi:anti-anti-sigma factor|nr:STAS domain-containing protein [Terracidiphilus sp.]
MATTSGPIFHYEVEDIKDELGGFMVTTIKCHGKLTSENSDEIRKLVQPLILRGGQIALDFADLQYLDSSGLGAIVGLKVSAINRGLCVLHLRNLTPRVKELLRITNLLQLFSS